MSSTRSRLLVVCLVSVFALLAESAFATHFRYGYMFWERDLTYVNPSAPNEVKVTVTVETGARWSYPSWTQATAPAGFTPVPRCTSGASVCCAGGVIAADAGSGSCPNVGSLIFFNGGSPGNLAFTRAVRIVGKHGVTLVTPLNIAAGGTMPVDVVVNQVIPTQDTFYGRFVFTMVMDKTAPVTLTWASGQRLSAMLDGNNDREWRLSTTIDASDNAVTKSPKTASSAIVNVISGQNNVVQLPDTTFDNLTPRWRVATAAESSLLAPVPVAPSVFTLNGATGTVNFTPRATGLYSVQFILEAVDANNTVKAAVPLDLMFQATTAGATYTETLATGDGQTTYTADVPNPISYTVRSTTSPANAGYNVSINHGVLPSGATFTQGSCPGNAVCVGTFNWTPTVTSTPANVCYNSTLTNGLTVVATSPQLCVTVNLNPLATSLTSFPASGAAGGGPLVLSAKLSRVIDNAPLSGRTITFTYPADPNNPPWIGTASAVTNASGIATATVTSVSPVEAIYQANFSAITNELLQSSSSTNVVSVKAATTLMNTPQVQTSPLPTIGYPLSATALLNRVFTDGGTVAVGADVLFTLSGPDGSTTTAITGSTGVASATFPSAPQFAGPYTVEAKFSGNASLFPNPDGSPATAVSAPFTLKQRTQLTIQPVTGATAGVPTAITVALNAIPSQIGLAGRSVQISGAFTGSPMTTNTNGAGLATFNVTFPAQATVTITAAYTPSSSETNRSAVIAAEAAALAVVVDKASTELALVAPPSTSTVGQALIAAATLTRVSAPAGVVSGASVTFTLTRTTPTPVTVTNQTATTNASGIATATFPAFTVAGTYTLSASFTTTPSLNAATSSVATFTVQTAQPTTLSVSPVVGVAGAPAVVTAHLQTNAGTPLSGQTILFTIGATSFNATTNSNGDATGSYIPATFGASSYSASFAGTPNYLASSANGTATIAQAATALAALSVSSTSLVGDALTVSTTLSRTSAPAGAIPGAPVTFTLTLPGGATQVQNGTTDSNGLVSVTFSPLTVRGEHTVQAAYAGSSSLNASSRPANVTVYQRTQLILNTAHGVATDSTSLSASLVTVPGNTPIAGGLIGFDFGGVVASGAAVADGNGVATISRTFASAGTYGATASFNDLAGYYVDATGNPSPTTATASVEQISIVTTLSAINLPGTHYVGDAITPATTLTRITAPAGTLSGEQITFALDAGTQQTVVTTAADGVASATLQLTSRGTHSVSAAYAGTTAITPSSTSTDFQVRQKVQLTLSQVQPAVAGRAVTFTAALTSIPGGPFGSAPVSFAFDGGVPQAQSVVTAPNGVATVTVTFPTSGTFNASATFNVGTDFANASGQLVDEVSTVAVNVVAAPTTLSTPTTPALGLVGDALSVSTTLSRVDGGTVGANNQVQFTFTAPDASTSTVMALTNAGGGASANFTPTKRGVHTVTASFASAGALAGSSSAAAANFPAYQRTQITATLVGSAIAGVSSSVSATLVALPGNTPIADGQVLFSTSVPGLGPTTVAFVGANASTAFVFPAAATVSVSAAHILPPGGFYADRNGAIAGDVDSTSLAAITVSSVTPSLSAPSMPASGVVGTAISLSSSLSGYGGAGQVGQAITFAITEPDGSIVTLNAITQGNGVATISFNPTQRGLHTAVASYAGNQAMLPATSAAGSTAVTQSTTMTTAAVTGAAGKPLAITARLRATPGSWGVSGETVVFAFSGVGAPAQASAVTDGNGYATVSPIFGSTGTFGVTASFAAASSYGASSASSTVTATNTPPTIIDLPDITAAATSAAGRLVNFTSTGNDAEDGAITPVCTASSGTFPIGTSSVTCTVTDIVGITAADSFTITITNAAPTIVNLPDINAAATSAAGRHVDFTSTGNDAEEGALTPVCTPNPGTFPIGATTVSCTVTDFAGLTASDSFTITITNNAPAFSAPANISLPATSPNGRAVTFSALGSDLEDGSLTADCQVRSGDTFPLGTTNIACTVTDVAGATASGSFSITITNTAPTIVDLPNINASATSAAGRTVNFTSTGNDAEDGALIPVCTASSGNFPLGTTNVSCTVTDVAGATASDSFSITITNNAPTFSAPANISLPATGANGRAVTFSALGSDIEDGSLTADCQVQSGNTFPIGTTNIACSVTDVAGATASGSFTITITNTAPTIADLQDLAGEATSASGRAFTFTSTGDDAEQGAITPVCSAGSGTFPIGTTNVTCTVTDIAGYTASDSFTITVVDTTAPVLSLPTIAPAFATSSAGRVVNYTVSALDIVDASTAVTCSPISGSTFPIATTTVNCSTSDTRGNTSTGSFAVSITNSAPTIVDLPNLSGEATSGSGRAFTFTSTGNDAEDGAKTPVCSAASGTFPIGTTNVTCTVTDVAGYSASDSFTITVNDTTAPAVTVTGITVEQTSPAGAVGIYAFSASDIVDGALTPTCTPASGSTFARGNTVVTCTRTDAHGNTGTSTATVTVVDTIKPVVTYTGNAGTYTADQVINITCAATDSGSGVATTTCANLTGPAHSFLVGVNTRTASATDVAGNTNSATISFTVTVPPAALGNVITQLVDSPAVAATLNHTLNLATGAPNANARASHLDKMIKDIQKEIGKSITAAEAATLINLINQLY